MRKLHEVSKGTQPVVITSKEKDLSTLRKIEKEVSFYVNGILVATQIINSKEINNIEWDYENLAKVFSVPVDVVKSKYRLFDYIDQEYKSGDKLVVTEKMIKKAIDNFLIMIS